VAIVLLAVACLPRTAWSEEIPVVWLSEGSEDAEGFTQVAMEFAATEAAVRRVLTDGRFATRLSPSVLSRTSQPRGACEEVQVTVDGLTSPMSYTMLRCPTPDGWHETLLNSEDFEDYELQWSIRESGETVRVQLRARLKLRRLLAPKNIVDRSLRKSLRKTLKSLAEIVDEQQRR